LIFYFLLLKALMHLAQALTLLPLGNFTHCKLGYFLVFTVGLYFPRSFLSFRTIIDPLPHISHCLPERSEG